MILAYRIRQLGLTSRVLAHATFTPQTDPEVGMGTALGGGFTDTRNLGFGLSDNARDWRIGRRLIPTVSGDSVFEVSLDSTCSERGANDGTAPEHGIILHGAMRW